ncbi:MAG: rod shape-determining protein MreD [Lachnospiraceae bacterium]|nr:rod shape-determining protein MreD [Lachnospiraceae bacterium]
MRRNLFIAVCMLLAFVLQSTVGKWIAFGGVSPNLLIIAVAAFGFMCGTKCGLITGFVAGILWDMFYGSMPGFYAMLLMYIGYMNGAFKQIFYKEDIKLPLILIMISDFIYGLVCYILQFLLRGRFHFPHYMLYVILPEVVYTMLLTMVIYPPLKSVTLKLDDLSQGRESSNA